MDIVMWISTGVDSMFLPIIKLCIGIWIPGQSVCIDLCLSLFYYPMVGF